MCNICKILIIGTCVHMYNMLIIVTCIHVCNICNILIIVTFIYMCSVCNILTFLTKIPFILHWTVWTYRVVFTPWLPNTYPLIFCMFPHFHHVLPCALPHLECFSHFMHTIKTIWKPQLLIFSTICLEFPS